MVLPDLEEFAQLEQEPLGMEAQRKTNGGGAGFIMYFHPPEINSTIWALLNVLCVLA